MFVPVFLYLPKHISGAIKHVSKDGLYPRLRTSCGKEDCYKRSIFGQDLHSVDLEEFKYGGTNITALRLLDPERADVQRVIRDWVYDEARKGRKLQLGHTSAKVLLTLDFLT